MSSGPDFVRRLAVSLALLVLSADGALAGSASGQAPTGSARTLEYPALYKAQNLPEYPEGKLVSTGRQVRSLLDGLRLEVETAASVTAAAKYYEDAMGKLGWKIQPQRVPNTRLHRSEFSRDRVLYTITIVERPAGGSKISIVVFEK